MVKIICPNCQSENIFLSKDDIQPECENCFEQFKQPIVFHNCEDADIEIESLTIIYQKTQEKIKIMKGDKVILGRENLGKEIFTAILSNGKPVISRKHCSFEFKNHKFILSDEGSLNGTYYGINKLDCSKNVHVIEDNSIIYIGEEVFLAKINFENKKAKVVEIISKEENIRKVKLYRCNDQNCSGYESEKIFELCPICNSIKSSIAIYE